MVYICNCTKFHMTLYTLLISIGSYKIKTHNVAKKNNYLKTWEWELARNFDYIFPITHKIVQLYTPLPHYL